MCPEPSSTSHVAASSTRVLHKGHFISLCGFFLLLILSPQNYRYQWQRWRIENEYDQRHYCVSDWITRTKKEQPTYALTYPINHPSNPSLTPIVFCNDSVCRGRSFQLPLSLRTPGTCRISSFLEHLIIII